MSDKKEFVDNNEALVKSLESIKSLLAKSETKLSAARDSLHQANQGTTLRESEIDIPTLDEVVETGLQFDIEMPIEEDAPVFKLDDDGDIEFSKSTMSIDTSSMAFDNDDEQIDIPVLEPESQSEQTPKPISANVDAPVINEIEVLPDLTPILNAIDEAEGTMRTQISETAIAFEEKLNNQLDAQMRKLRDQVQLLVDEFGD